MEIAQLTPILEHPHWRVNYRPHEYNAETLKTLNECQQLVSSTKLSLRGWDYPHINTRTNWEIGQNWVGSAVQFGNHLEYWRLYQSGQFIHYQAVREVLDADWHQKLLGAARSHASWRTDIAWDKVPGFFSLLNFLYTVTEIFEFAARIAQAGVYSGEISIDIGLRGVKGFVLTPEIDRAWMDVRAASADKIEHVWNVHSRDLVAGSSEAALDACVWFFERFNWMQANVEQLRRDQTKFMSGRW